MPRLRRTSAHADAVGPLDPIGYVDLCSPAGAGLGAQTKKMQVVWFMLDEYRLPFAFAGIWAEFRSDRGTKSKPIPGPHLVYGFLTASPNTIVEPIHPKAMPVVLTTDEERDVWMHAP
jgi:putative SOS response-associated peptidase YedK